MSVQMTAAKLQTRKNMIMLRAYFQKFPGLGAL
jgi:hypothetical protein